MTAAVLTSSIHRPEPTLGVAAGRVLALAGTVFGSANLFQYGVQSGALELHEAVLGLSWPLAVGVFLTGLMLLRRAGGETARRVAGWSRTAIFSMLALVGALLAASIVQRDFTLMLWGPVATLAAYGLVWTVAFFRARQANMALIAGVAFTAAVLVSGRLGTPDQSLLQAAAYGLVALLPGLWLANGRRL